MTAKRVSRVTWVYVKVAAVVAALIAAGGANWPKHR
jgi:hypothetical protein